MSQMKKGTPTSSGIHSHGWRNCCTSRKCTMRTQHNASRQLTMVIGDIARFPADNWTMRVRMVDSQPGARSEAHEWEFELPRITLRALLRSRVAREVEAYNVQLPEVFHGLVQPEESERILNG